MTPENKALTLLSFTFSLSYAPTLVFIFTRRATGTAG